MNKRVLLLLGTCLLSQENAWASKDQNVVIVRKGENLLDVANRASTTTDDLIKSNGLLKPYKIYIGQPLIYNKVNKTTQPVEQRPKPTPVNTQRANKPVPIRDYYAEERAAIAQTVKEQAPTTNLSVAQGSQKDIQRSGKYFSWPVEGKIISAFGKKQTGRKNDGINIEAKFQSAVKAAEDGEVVYAGNEIRGFGNVILIKHGDGWSSIYAHNDRLLVSKGDQVKRGQEIAKSGNTGHVDTPQLHFELRQKTQPVDPVKYLK